MSVPTDTQDKINCCPVMQDEINHSDCLMAFLTNTQDENISDLHALQDEINWGELNVRWNQSRLIARWNQSRRGRWTRDEINCREVVSWVWDDSNRSWAQYEINCGRGLTWDDINHGGSFNLIPQYRGESYINLDKSIMKEVAVEFFVKMKL